MCVPNTHRDNGNGREHHRQMIAVLSTACRELPACWNATARKNSPRRPPPAANEDELEATVVGPMPCGVATARRRAARRAGNISVVHTDPFRPAANAAGRIGTKHHRTIGRVHPAASPIGGLPRLNPAKIPSVEPRAATRKPDTFTGWLGVLHEGRMRRLRDES